MKPKLLVIELWGVGDLVIATPFLQAAVQKFEVSLLAKSYARDMQALYWPEVTVIPFNAPWTAFREKYRFWRWPLLSMAHLCRMLVDEHFDFGFSARWDPRDHVLLKMASVTERLGFSRIGSGVFLTRRLVPPAADAHRYESWRVGAEALGIGLPPRDRLAQPKKIKKETILLHSGARLPARIWPLENWRALALDLRRKNYDVQIACDPGQEDWWKNNGESELACPRTVNALVSLINDAAVLIGNCSGPGHLAAISGTPTFTIFGPSLSEWFAPLHPHSEWIEGKSCPYKPCSDYCHFPRPFCIQDVSVDEVRPRVEHFVERWVVRQPEG